MTIDKENTKKRIKYIMLIEAGVLKPAITNVQAIHKIIKNQTPEPPKVEELGKRKNNTTSE